MSKYIKWRKNIKKVYRWFVNQAVTLFENDKRRIQDELSRRYNEVHFSRDEKINTTGKTQEFFLSIANYMNYVHINQILNRYVHSLQEQFDDLEVNTQLLEEGNQLISELQTDFEKIKQILSQNNFQIKPIHEIITPNYVGSLDPSQAIHLHYNELNSWLLRVDKDVKQIPDKVAVIKLLSWAIDQIQYTARLQSEMQSKYDPKVFDYETKLRTQGLSISFLRLDSYHALNEVWDYYYGAPSNWTYFKFEIGMFLNEKVKYSLNESDMARINRRKQELINCLPRFNNYLLDNLERKDIWHEIYKWLWEKLVSSVVSILVGLYIFKLLAILGIEFPILFIQSVLGIK